LSPSALDADRLRPFRLQPSSSCTAATRTAALSNLDSACAALASDAPPTPGLRGGHACSHVTNHGDDPRSKFRGVDSNHRRAEVCCQGWRQSGVNKRSTGLRHPAGSQQKRFRSVMPLASAPESTRTRRDPLLIPRSQVRSLHGPSRSTCKRAAPSRSAASYYASRQHPAVDPHPLQSRQLETARANAIPDRGDPSRRRG
jgi:hypothetical protein